jgi:hypothetical protein
MNLKDGRSNMTDQKVDASEKALIKDRMDQDIEKKIILHKINNDINKNLTSKSKCIELDDESIYLF